MDWFSKQSMRYLLGKKQRVIRKDDFTRTLRKGNCAADGTLVVFALPAKKSPIAKLGITIPKKMGNAVVRNRWKRLIRESFRTQQDQVPPGFDYIVRPKKGAKPMWSEIEKSIPKLTKKAAARCG